MSKIDKIKALLKFFKLHESTISAILGSVVIVIVALLVVRYFRSLNTSGTLPKDNGLSIEQEVPKIGKNYTVQKGDNLWRIAEEAYGSGYNWVDIAQANNLANANQIEAGQIILLPDVETRVKTISERETSEQKITSIVGATYTVQKGDNLWDIAVRAYGDGYRWLNIAQENNLTNPNIIHAGNVLTLPR